MSAFEWQKQIGLEHPVVQAGMGGGVTTCDLVAAVSNAGGLGTVGIMPAERFRAELQQVKRQCDGRPFAANLLMPFTKKQHVQACLDTQPAVVVLFYGHNKNVITALQDAGSLVFSQVGNPDQAREALSAGVDGLIAQGAEAGGHLASNRPLDSVFADIRTLAAPKPVLIAGGIYNAQTASEALAKGAAGVVSGTRFLLTHECNAHDAYKAELLRASDTVATELFGLSWVAPHRVAVNPATRRWCDASGKIPGWLRVLDTCSAPSRQFLSLATAGRLTNYQRPGIPLYTPLPLIREMNQSLLDVTPLYAGECVADIHTLLPAAKVVSQLAQA